MYTCLSCGETYEKLPLTGFCGQCGGDLESDADIEKEPEKNDGAQKVGQPHDIKAGNIPAPRAAVETPVTPVAEPTPIPAQPQIPIAEPKLMPEQPSDKEGKTDNTRRSPWPKILISPYILFGLLALIISGYIEFLFFNGIFRDFLLYAILFAIVFEGVKTGTIILGKYFKIVPYEGVSRVMRVLNITTRTVLIVFSVICSFGKIAEFMNAPNYAAEVQKATGEINTQFDSIYRRNYVILKAVKDSAYKRFNDERLVTGYNGVYVGINYKQKRAEDSIANIALSNWTVECQRMKDSALTKMKVEVRDGPSSKSQLLVGLHTAITNAGMVVPFNKFYACFVLVISFFTSALLELIIMTVFNYATIIYSGVKKTNKNFSA